MSDQTFKAFVVEESEGGFTSSIQDKKISDLPENELLVKVEYSSLNYKDALSASGNKGVTRKFPHTPGIDAVGVVVSDASDTFSPGDVVIVTSYDLGMNTDGGFAEYIRVPAAWALVLPQGMTKQQAMMFGTAGLTAAQSVAALCEKISPDAGEILVTGATGGVGSLAVSILAKLGYKVCALTGKASAHDFLMGLGADSVIDRNEFVKDMDRPLLKPRWAGVVDCVGGDILSTAIKSAQPLAVITCCGMVGSPDLSITVFPFILRGVQLVGIDSQSCPMALREKLWMNLAGPWKPEGLSSFVKTVKLEQLAKSIENILAGKQQGRTLVEL